MSPASRSSRSRGTWTAQSTNTRLEWSHGGSHSNLQPTIMLHSHRSPSFSPIERSYARRINYLQLLQMDAGATPSPAPSGIVSVPFTPGCLPPRPPSTLASSPQQPSTSEQTGYAPSPRMCEPRSTGRGIGASYLRTLHRLFPRWKHPRDDLGHAGRWGFSLGCTWQDDIVASTSKLCNVFHPSKTHADIGSNFEKLHASHEAFNPLPSNPTLLYIHSRHRTVVSTR